MAFKNNEPTFTASQWNAFFNQLRLARSVSRACAAAGISRATAYRFKGLYPHINEQWEEALLAGKEYLEDAAVDRAIDGTARTHTHYDRSGKVASIEEEKKFSDRLHTLLLRGRIGIYRDNPNTRVDIAVAKELERVFDVLRTALPNDDYQRIINLIANDDSTTDSTQTSERNFDTETEGTDV